MRVHHMRINNFILVPLYGAKCPEGGATKMSEIMSKYESVLVISMKLGEEGIQKLIEKFKALIEKNATLDTVDEWGKRRLAYMINKESEGYYVLFNFTSNADFPAELDRRYKITDGVLRTLIIKKDEE